MHIDAAIKALEQAKALGVKHIVIATWEAEIFGLTEDDPEWKALADYIDQNHDWSYTHEELMSTQQWFNEISLSKDLE